MEQQETKYVVELRKGYTEDNGIVSGGEWETLKDEFNCDRIFDYFCQAHRVLEGHLPMVKMLGSSIGRVKEVVMINKRKE